jgi:putative membrane protein
MRYLLRCFLFTTFALWLTSQVIPGIEVSGGWQGMLFTALVLSLLMLIVRPILKILFIPINIMTFGLLSWGVNIIVVYLLTFLVPGVIISNWNFQGFASYGFVIPAFRVSYILSLTLITVFLTITTNILHDISEH